MIHWSSNEIFDSDDEVNSGGLVGLFFARWPAVDSLHAGLCLSIFLQSVDHKFRLLPSPQLLLEEKTYEQAVLFHTLNDLCLRQNFKWVQAVLNLVEISPIENLYHMINFGFHLNNVNEQVWFWSTTLNKFARGTLSSEMQLQAPQSIGDTDRQIIIGLILLAIQNNNKNLLRLLCDSFPPRSFLTLAFNQVYQAETITLFQALIDHALRKIPLDETGLTLDYNYVRTNWNLQFPHRRTEFLLKCSTPTILTVLRIVRLPHSDLVDILYNTLISPMWRFRLELMLNVIDPFRIARSWIFNYVIPLLVPASLYSQQLALFHAEYAPRSLILYSQSGLFRVVQSRDGQFSVSYCEEEGTVGRSLDDLKVSLSQVLQLRAFHRKLMHDGAMRKQRTTRVGGSGTGMYVKGHDGEASVRPEDTIQYRHDGGSIQHINDEGPV